MPSHTITFHLDAPPERVFDYIADIRNEAEWSKDITSVELVGDGPIGQGTEFDTVYRGFGAMVQGPLTDARLRNATGDGEATQPVRRGSFRSLTRVS